MDIFKQTLNYCKDPSTYIRKIYSNCKIIGSYLRDHYRLLLIELDKIMKLKIVNNI